MNQVTTVLLAHFMINSIHAQVALIQDLIVWFHNHNALLVQLDISAHLGPTSLIFALTVITALKVLKISSILPARMALTVIRKV